MLEALTGVDFVLTHLDGSKIRIKNKPGEVIKPEDIKTVPDKGLPFHKSSYKFGNLFVMFKVKFPDTLQDAQVPNIAKALSTMKKADAEMKDVVETVELKPFDES